MKEIRSHKELLHAIENLDKAYLLLYKKGSEQSDCAYANLSEASNENKKVHVFVADTNLVRDIHPKYDITSAPTMVVFEKGEFKNVVKGCHHPGFFQSVFESAVVHAAHSDRPKKNVTVYTTPTCTWCNTLKTYLRKNGIAFREVDVSRDQSAAEAMVRRSGQQGVPQTDIEGTMIVGFDKTKINSMLGIGENG
ncbi:MAG: glutaredoxin domain-containing protein [Bacteroidales bacterium]|jgi:glutaredoxin-like YruB-family protein|nr:glutaredoxin domain-containing protein [Bacteroidales bacterium]